MRNNIKELQSKYNSIMNILSQGRDHLTQASIDNYNKMLRELEDEIEAEILKNAKLEK